MNSLEKKSFYSFLSLYIISSFIFILLSAYWYYAAQKNSLEINQYYKFQHIADTISQKIIYAHMQKKKLELPRFEQDVSIALIDINNKVVYGTLPEKVFPKKAEYIENGKETILISDSPMHHLNIAFVVVQSKALFEQIKKLQQHVFIVIFFSTIIMIFLAWWLSRLFMKPLHQRVSQIEGFVHDTAHELNTPITALSMSVSKALKNKKYDEKVLKNISISTKQLFDIYNALSYLSFDPQGDDTTTVDAKDILSKSVIYYKELSESKNIEILVEAESLMLKYDSAKLSMLFGNLISNAIKYSHRNSVIEITLKDGALSVQDYGIGIEEERLSKIYDLYNRETDYAGGFGVGLSIVKKICNEYNISVNVHSEKDKGSCFSLVF